MNEKIKEMGKAKYIIFHWIIPSGIPVALFFSIIKMVFRYRFEFSQEYMITFITSFIFYLILCTVICIILGSSKWKRIIKSEDNK